MSRFYKFRLKSGSSSIGFTRDVPCIDLNLITTYIRVWFCKLSRYVMYILGLKHDIMTMTSIYHFSFFKKLKCVILTNVLNSSQGEIVSKNTVLSFMQSSLHEWNQRSEWSNLYPHAYNSVIFNTKFSLVASETKQQPFYCSSRDTIVNGCICMYELDDVNQNNSKW